jgi:hypothetical protein
MKWIHSAACAGSDPIMFDHYMYPQAIAALTICGTCKFTVECVEWVKPNKSFFDGVAGGVVWRNGYRVRPDNTTREDRFIRLRGEKIADPTPIPEIYGQRTLPFD